jgi:hypothetical protein
VAIGREFADTAAATVNDHYEFEKAGARLHTGPRNNSKNLVHSTVTASVHIGDPPIGPAWVVRGYPENPLTVDPCPAIASDRGAVRGDGRSTLPGCQRSANSPR